MRDRSDAGRRTLAAVAAAAIALTLAGCAGSATGDGALQDDKATPTGAPTSTTSERPSDPGSSGSPSASTTSTVPSGDPGPGAPGTDDPNGDLGDGGESHQDSNAKTSVPRTAVLDAETVAAVAGGSWTSSAAPANSCTAPRPAKAVATRSTQLRGTGSAGQIVETVATHRGTAAAIAAVKALERRLTACHATAAHDPRIGDASVQLTLTAADGTVTVVTAAAAEGVTFVLSGSGPVTAPDHWSALTDIALGSTCVAATEGCH